MAVCAICVLKLKNPNRSGLLDHKESQKHKNNVIAKRNTVDVSSFFKASQDLSLAEKAAKAEIGVIAEHHTSFLQSKHLVQTLKEAFSDRKVAQQKKLGKTKASYCMQHGIP